MTSVLKRVFGNPYDKKISEKLRSQAEVARKAAFALEQLMLGIGDAKVVQSRLDEIVELEHTADETTRDLNALIDEAFITKIRPRPHAIELVKSLDDIIDDIHDAARYIAIYKLNSATQYSLELCATINQVVEILNVLLSDIVTLKPVVLAEGLKKINISEHRADELRTIATGILAAAVVGSHSPQEGVGMLYQLTAWKDVLSKLERVTDHALRAGVEIETIVHANS